MTLAEFAGTAEMVVAGGVIASLPVVAWEIRKNTSQSKQANWGGHWSIVSMRYTLRQIS